MNAKSVIMKVGRILLWLVHLWVTITLILLFLAFFLLLFGANPDAGFVEWVYRSTERAMAPFRGIFEPIELTDDSVLELSVLFAIIVYALVAMGLSAAISWLTRRLMADQQRHDMLAAHAAVYGPAHVVHVSGATGWNARAVLTPNASGASIELNAAGLDPERLYSVWLEGAIGGRVSAATFQPNSLGDVGLTFSTPMVLTQTTTFGLTQLAKPGEMANVDLIATQMG